MSDLIDRTDFQHPRIMHAAVSTYIALGGIWVLLLVLFTFVMVAKRNSIEGVLLSGAILVFILIWVRSFKIEISIEGINYRSPFFRHGSVKWSSITSVNIGAKWKYPKSPLIMMIKSHDGARPVTINIKVFGRTDVAALARAIRYFAPQAMVDNTIHRMSRGQMPSVLKVES